MNPITIILKTIVNPTEDISKVKIAIENLIYNPQSKIVSKNNEKIIVARAKNRDDLKKIYDLFNQQRIRNVARMVMKKGLQERGIIFYVNKQAAYMKRISFCVAVAESPLGPIRIEITCTDPKGLINWLSPSKVSRKK